jgi:hypothetical protein
MDDLDVDDLLLREWMETGQHAAKADEWYRRANAMHERADYYLRELLRELHYEHGLTYRQMAEVLNANLSSRQATWAKWKRLIDPARQKPGQRTGWVKGRKRGPDGTPS